MSAHYYIHNDRTDLIEALCAFQYATKVRISLLSGLSPAMISHPHEHYGSHKDFYSMEWSVDKVSVRLSHYAARGFIPWGFSQKGQMEERFDDYLAIVRRALYWSFNHVLNVYKTNHRELAAYLAQTIIKTEEGLYSWALNL